MATEEHRREWSERLLSWVGLPGWAIVILGGLWDIFIAVPEIHHAIEFWLGAAEHVGGSMTRIAAIITSPWFGLGLVVLGMGYLVFVGEPRWQIRHPLAPLFGWTVVGVAVLAFVFVMGAGYAAVQLDPEGRAAMEYVTALEGENTIVLLCEPITNSVQIIVDHAELLPSEYTVEKDRIKLSDSDAKVMRDVVAHEPAGDAFVRYTKRSATCK